MAPSGGYWRQLMMWGGWVLAAYVFWRWLAGYTMPFVLAVVLAGVVRPLVTRFERWGLGRVPAVLLALGGLSSACLVVAGAILTLLAAELVQMSHRMPVYLHHRPRLVEQILQQWNALRAHWGFGRGSLPQEFQSAYRMAGALAKSVAHALVLLPEAGLILVIGAVAAFFILRDYEVVAAAGRRLVPPRLGGRMGRLSSAMTGGLWGYVRAELALVSLTALVTTGGLLIIRAPYAVLVGLTAGLLDLVPFAGPTMLLLPWAIGAAVTGRWPLAIHLIMVLGAAALMRQLVEPRLVGQGTGLHPLVVLFSLYLGVRLFGGAGVVLGPVTAIMFNAVRQVIGPPGVD